MTVFQFLRGPYLVLLGVAVLLHILLAYFAPDQLDSMASMAWTDGIRFTKLMPTHKSVCSAVI